MRSHIPTGSLAAVRDAPTSESSDLKLLSVVIPARDEEACIASTVEHLRLELRLHEIEHEIIVVDDGSTDKTPAIVTALGESTPCVRLITNGPPHGFGRAIVRGLQHMRGDAVVIMMADESDDCRDVVRYWQALNEGWEAVFGSRFMKGGGVIDYPWFKLRLNRLANGFIRLMFGISLNDTTNAFKAYRRNVIEGCQPLLSAHFNLTVEIPLKAAIRGYSWTVIPITWRNRRTGVAKLKIQEMGSRYLFICLYLWLEKHLSRGDYRRRDT
jgi:dolichol-phosphate mannosyltransferase